MIICQSLYLTRDNQKIFEDFSFTVKKGVKACLWGASGSGKSTLLKILMGLVIPDAGSIKIAGQTLEAKQMHYIRSQIAWLPQNIDLNIESTLHLMDLLQIHSNLHPQLESLLESLGLAPNIIQADFDKISGGQKQRILIALCLVQNKPILLLDEPTSALDPQALGLLIQLIRRHSQLTLLSASHNLTWKQSCQQIIEL